MTKRTRVLIGSGALLTLAAVVIVVLLVRPERGADRLIGSWEGEGTSTAGLNLGGEKADVRIKSKASVRATFNRDGTMTMSMRVEGDGFRFKFEVPDPKKPGEVSRWAVVRTEGGAVVVRLMDPDHAEAPEWRIVFQGGDGFIATPLTGEDRTPLTFHRTGR